MNSFMQQRHSTSNRAVFLSLLVVLAATRVLALPEDAEKPLEVAAGDAELYLDQGLTVINGTDAEPAVITKGTMKISGTEIRIENSDDSIAKVTATGNPARYEQQIKIDQAPIQVSGLTLIFDNLAQTLVIDEQAELIQAGINTTGHHIDYDLATNRVRVTMDPDGEQIRMVIPPAGNQ